MKALRLWLVLTLAAMALAFAAGYYTVALQPARHELRSVPVEGLVIYRGEGGYAAPGSPATMVAGGNTTYPAWRTWRAPFNAMYAAAGAIWALCVIAAVAAYVQGRKTPGDLADDQRKLALMKAEGEAKRAAGRIVRGGPVRAWQPTQAGM